MNPTTNEFWVKRLFGEKTFWFGVQNPKRITFYGTRTNILCHGSFERMRSSWFNSYFNDRTSEGEKTPLLKHRTNGHIHTSEKKKPPKVKCVYMLGKLYIFRDGLRTCVHGSSFSGFSIYIFQITRVQFTPPRLLEFFFFFSGVFQ